MHSPATLALKLARQWHNNQTRCERLLSPAAWPLELKIALPQATEVAQQAAAVRQHIETWRQQKIGEVVWIKRRYRDAAEPLELPQWWRIRKPSEWVAACDSPQIAQDYDLLNAVIPESEPLFHEFLVSQLNRIRSCSSTELTQIVKTASALQPGAAHGQPLRSLSLLGTDSKFFERHQSLITRLLDLRFADQVSAMGLEAFLQATSSKTHWLLLYSSDAGLLPYQQIRVRSSELQQRGVAAHSLLLVENEQCLHLLPEMPDTLVILGSGNNLSWLHNAWLADKQLGYWGDIDSWGFAMLAQARLQQPHLQALLMDLETYQQHQGKAVSEAVSYSLQTPAGLLPEEAEMYQFLIAQDKARLEQEFIAANWVHNVLIRWLSGSQ